MLSFAFLSTVEQLFQIKHGTWRFVQYTNPTLVRWRPVLEAVNFPMTLTQSNMLLSLAVKYHRFKMPSYIVSRCHHMIARDPLLYTCRVKQAIQVTLNPKNLNRDNDEWRNRQNNEDGSGSITAVESKSQKQVDLIAWRRLAACSRNFGLVSVKFMNYPVTNCSPKNWNWHWCPSLAGFSWFILLKNSDLFEGKLLVFWIKRLNIFLWHCFLAGSCR